MMPYYSILNTSAAKRLSMTRKFLQHQARHEPTREGSRRTAHVGCTTRRTLLESHRLWSRPWETTLYQPRGDEQRSRTFR